MQICKALLLSLAVSVCANALAYTQEAYDAAMWLAQYSKTQKIQMELLLAAGLEKEPEQEPAKSAFTRLKLMREIISCEQTIADARSVIAKEKRIAEESGVVDQNVLHVAGKNIVDCEDNIQANFVRYREVGGSRALTEIKQMKRLELTPNEERIFRAEIDHQKAVSEAAAREAEMKAKALAEGIPSEAFVGGANAREEDAANKALSEWIVLVEGKVRRNWQRLPNLPPELVCTLQISQLSSGEIADVKIVRSSGNKAYDDSVERAIRKSSPLPKLNDALAFSMVRETNLKFGAAKLANQDQGPIYSPPSDTDVRTREEVQTGFDRNKSALSVIINRALRDNPNLSGKIEINFTVQPDGSVTGLKMISSELGDAELERKILSRIQSINFGAKTVQPFTVESYPIVVK